MKNILMFILFGILSIFLHHYTMIQTAPVKEWGISEPILILKKTKYSGGIDGHFHMCKIIDITGNVDYINYNWIKR